MRNCLAQFLKTVLRELGCYRETLYMAVLKFYCDESYDSKSKSSNVYVVGGFVAEASVWCRVERRFNGKNRRVGVHRFHGSHLNALDHEFKGWTGQRSKRYVKELLEILRREKRRLHAVSVGILNKDYERIVGPGGRVKFGHPYVVCFKECVALIAQEMDRWWPPEYKLEVFLDRNPFEMEAVKVFNGMRDGAEWPLHDRLTTCIPASGDEVTALQPADLIAYETFRLLHEKHFGKNRVRRALQKLLPTNGFSGFYYDAEILERIKQPLEESSAIPNGFIVMHDPKYTEDVPAEAYRNPHRKG